MLEFARSLKLYVYLNVGIVGILFYLCNFSIFSISQSETPLTLRRTERDMIINVYWSSFKISVTIVSF
jgi:hypothetical protein